MILIVLFDFYLQRWPDRNATKSIGGSSVSGMHGTDSQWYRHSTWYDIILLCNVLTLYRDIKIFSFLGNMCDLNWKAPLSLSRSPSQCFNVYDIRLYLDNCNDMNWPNGKLLKFRALIIDQLLNDNYRVLGVEHIRKYLNRKEVREAIHAQHDPTCFEDCSDAVGNSLYGDNNLASIDVLVELLNNDIRVLLYNGQFDYICNHLGTEMALENLNWAYLQVRKTVKKTNIQNNSNYRCLYSRNIKRTEDILGSSIKK